MPRETIDPTAMFTQCDTCGAIMTGGYCTNSKCGGEVSEDSNLLIVKMPVNDSYVYPGEPEKDN